MSNNLGDADKAVEQSKTVNVIASGYEWVCPTCKTFNRTIEHTEIVTCESCKLSFKTDLPEHCYG